ILRGGYAGLFVGRSFGRGIMPLSFASLKSQRFRWCFGGMQILRMHWQDLLPWNRDPSNHLGPAQRIDYLLGGLQWLNDLVLLGFSIVLLSVAVGLVLGGRLALRPLLGATAILPIALIASGLLRAVWALRARTGIKLRRALLAFANWLSLSWTVALACALGLFRREGVFLRTPKEGDRANVVTALRTTRTETLLTGVLWGAGVWLLATHRAGLILAALFLWQGVVYACAPYMAWLNQHTELSAQLERRRRSEWMRERVSRVAPAVAAGAAIWMLVTSIVALAIVLGSSSSTTQSQQLFTLPHSSGGPVSPIGSLLQPSLAPSVPATSTTVPVSPSTSPSPTTSSATPTVSPTIPPSPGPTPTAPTPSTSVAPPNPPPS
ncbi:MAG TPA: hypothetical protein VGI39_16055, partial [Polyangiaceae bacterium]